MEHIKKGSIINTAELIFQIVFLIYTMLGFNSITYGNSVISIIMWGSYLLGMVLVLIRLINWKKYIKFPGLIFLVIMCVICVLSIVANYQYDMKNNIIYLIFWVFYFFMFYAQSSDISTEQIKKRFNILAQIVCAVAFVLTLVSLVMLIVQYAAIIDVDGYKLIRGFVYGRLFGAYLTPNSGAVFGSVVIILLIHYFRQYKNIGYRIYAVLNILVQFLYIVFSDSRSGTLSLAFGCTLYVFCACFFDKELKQRKRGKAIILALTVVTIVVTLFGPKLVQKGYNELIGVIGGLESTSSEKIDLSNYQVDRGYSLEGDISNRRFDIWKSGLEIFCERPWLGTTFSGFLPFAKEKLPDTYIVTNDYMEMNTLDNDFLNLLVSNGIFCFAAYILFVIFILVYLIKQLFMIGEQDKDVPAMLGVCMSVATFSMFTSGVLYMRAPYTIMFWMALGSLIAIIKQGKKGGEE